MARLEPFPKQDCPGRCHDIVTLDRPDLASSTKDENAIDARARDGHMVETRDGKFMVPAGVDHRGIVSLSWESRSRLISSSDEFQQEFKGAVEADAGVDGAFEFSGGASRSAVSRLTESRKNGAGTEVAQKKASTVDAEGNLARPALEFRGGPGAPTGMDDPWIQSRDDRPAVVKAKLEKLPALPTSRFVPDLAAIDACRALPERAIDTWVRTKGTRGRDKRPSRCGRRLFWPRPGPTASWPIAGATLARASGRGAGTILAGDLRDRAGVAECEQERRARQPNANLVAGADTVFTILPHGDDPVPAPMFSGRTASNCRRRRPTRRVGA